MALGTSDFKKPAAEPAKAAKGAKPRKATAAEEAGPASAVKAEAKAVDKPAKGLTRVYPTHRRQTGDLVVALPAGLDEDGNSHSGEIIIADKGADIDSDLAQQLIDAREVTKKAPKDDDAEETLEPAEETEG